MSSIEKAIQRQKTQQKKSSIESAVEKKQAAAESSVEQTAPTEQVVNTPPASTQAGQAPEAPATEPAKREVSNSDPKPAASDDKKVFNLDLKALEDKGYIAIENTRTLINEEYRGIKRKLLNNAFGPISSTLKNSNLILVTSSKPNEGKTFTAVNLALSIALEQDKNVLLVDSDVLKPSVHKSMDLGKNEGLIEYLLGEKDNVSDVIYATNIDRLRIIPAGFPHHLSNELLSSDKMMKLIEEFATRYPDRIVVFDAPPLLGVNETVVVAEQCGQCLMVVEENKSKLSDVKKATELLPEEMAVGFLINKATSTSSEGAYGYYYAGSDDSK